MASVTNAGFSKELEAFIEEWKNKPGNLIMILHKVQEEQGYISKEAAAAVADSIINDQKKMIPCSAYLEGEYGYNDITIGVPCIIGKNGIEKIVEIELNEAEKALFAASEEAVAKTTAILKEINVL